MDARSKRGQAKGEAHHPLAVRVHLTRLVDVWEPIRVLTRQRHTSLPAVLLALRHVTPFLDLEAAMELWVEHLLERVGFWTARVLLEGA